MDSKLKYLIVIVLMNLAFTVKAAESEKIAIPTEPPTLSEICITKNSSSWGQNLQCASPSLVFGLCGSGKNTDCANGSVANQLYCCDEPGVNSIGTSTTIKSNNFGEQVTCPTGQVMTAFCGSGKNHDCNDGDYVNTITCAIVDSITLQNETNTWFSTSNFGEAVYCPNAMVATGACGSGKNADCPGGTVNQVRCTTYTIN